MRDLPKLLVGLAVLLALGELGYAWRDGFAWPHLSVYAADAELGVRLRPGAEQRVRPGGNPTTTVRIGTHGHRGEPWGDDVDVLVLGDSQVFGLGVEEDARFSDVLAQRTGLAVANAGVPTYGPGEMLAQLDTLLALRPDVVIWTLNMANDLFEVEVPNRMRHTAWDGWSVQASVAPSEPRDFPGRAWLLRDSHLVYGLRRATHLLRGRAGLLDGPMGAGGWDELLALQQARRGVDEPWPILAPLTQAQARTDAAGARLLVAVLPLDVQLDPDAWDRYGAPPLPLDLSLNQALLAALDEADLEAVDLAPPLQATLPGAFLHGDLHLTPRGHAAVAERLEQALAEEPPKPREHVD